MIDEGIVIFSGGSHQLRVFSNLDRQRYGYLPFRLSKYPTRIHGSHSGFAIKKESVLKALFQPIIMRLTEAVIIEHFSRSTSYYYWRSEKEEVPTMPLNLQHMMIGYVMYCIGLFISALIFTGELLNAKI